MPTTNVYPTADVQTTWTPTPVGAHWSTLDDAPAAPADADFVETTTLSVEDEVALGDSPANTSQVQSVQPTVRGFINDASATAKIRFQLFRAGPVQVGGDIDVTGTNFGGYGTTPANFQITWSGLTLTKAQFDSCTLRYKLLGV